MIFGKDTSILITDLSACFRIAPPAVLIWRVRPRQHFSTSAAWRSFNTRFAGYRAGCSHSAGYCQIRMTIGGVRYNLLAHRVIFALTNNRWPTDEVDHMDRGRTDDQPLNLREATSGQNKQNTSLRSTNTSGVKGVFFDNNRAKWVAQLVIDGRVIYKRFRNKADAILARKDAELKHHPYRVP